ncbi:MAG: uracil-DNA glycosylase [Rickettsiaceae bacterium]|nr:uracil-DNA glycosylase [Rickettsiaceae bacterium]
MDKLQQKLNNLKWLKSAGIEYYCSEKKDSKNSLIKTLKEQKVSEVKIEAPIVKPTKVKPVATQEPTAVNNSPVITEARALADKASNLDELYKFIENFNGCELKEFARHTVFSDGVTNAPILLLGEAPGATEDELGIPFCGESGVMLDRMLESINISRKTNAYITNTVFWRPPANRRPTNTEVEICKPFVEKHIALIKPKLIILVGSTATTSLLGKKAAISEIRQNNYPYINKYLSEAIPTTAIFHPAYLLRQPSQKKITWYDLLKIQDFLKTNVPEFQ